MAQPNEMGLRYILNIKRFFGKKYLRFSSTLIALLFLFCQSVIADEIYLRNGDRISGQLVDLSPIYCIFTTSHQATLYIERQEVLQLRTIQPVVVELNSSERIVGMIENAEENGIIMLQSERFGTLSVRLTDIMRITRVENAFVTNPTSQPVEKEPSPPLPRQLDSSSIQRQKVSPTFATVKNNIPTQPSKQTFLKTTQLNQPTQQQSSENEPAPPLKRDERDENENNIRQTVSRQATVLLKAGEQEMAVGLTYGKDTTADARTRSFELPLIMRVGLTNRLESSLYIPVIWSEYTAFYNDRQDYAFGVGDMTLNFNYLFSRETTYWPDVYGTVGFSIPTGDEYATLEPDVATTGSGHWNLSSGFTLAKSYDPAVLFGGLAYTHTFKRTFSGVEVAPGDSLDYYFGLGLAINPELSLGFQFLSTYQRRTKYNGKTIGLSYEPMYLALSLPYNVDRSTYVEPSLKFGLNDEATDVMLDFYYSHKF